MYAEQLRERYRDIGLRLRPPVPPRVRLKLVEPDAPRFTLRWTQEYHVLPLIIPAGLVAGKKIIAATVALSGIDRARLLGHGRTIDVMPYRHVMQMIMRDHTGLSYPMIGRYLGNRDHTSCMHAARRGRQLVETHPHWRAFHDAVLKAISVTPSYVLSERR